MRNTIWVLILVSVWVLEACPAYPAVEEYVQALHSRVPAVRRQSAVALGRMGDRSAVPALIEALGDTEKDVRRESAKALGLIKDARAVPVLIEALGDGEMNVRFYAAYALGEIKDSRSAGPLLHALGDSRWCVRDQAAWALRELRDPKIAAPLVAALKKDDADAAHILWVLRYVGGPRAVEQLASLLDDPDAQTRMRAAGGLGELGDKRAVVPLVAVLKDADPGVRRTAIEALLPFRDDRTRKPLARLATGDDDPSVRRAAEKALLRLSRREDLAAYWSFDDRNTRVAVDATGHGNDGRIRGCAPVKGKVGAALKFGKGKYIALGRPAGLPLGGQPLTVMAWVKSDADNGVIVARGGAFCGFSLYIKEGVARFGIHRVQDGPAYIAAGRKKVVGSWVHLAGVIKQDRIELLVDGKLAATADTPGYIPGNCGQGMEIGYDEGNSPAEITDPFQGIIDEVKVYRAALSEKDVAAQRGSD